jgi:hypothetical protein
MTFFVEVYCRIMVQIIILQKFVITPVYTKSYHAFTLPVYIRFWYNREHFFSGIFTLS